MPGQVGTLRTHYRYNNNNVQAYDTLMNANARRAYDAQLEVALRDEEDGYTGAAPF